MSVGWVGTIMAAAEGRDDDVLPSQSAAGHGYPVAIMVEKGLTARA